MSFSVFVFFGPQNAFSFFPPFFSWLFNWVRPPGRQGQTVLPAKIEIRQQFLSSSSQVEMFFFDSLKRGLPLMQLINMDECFISGEKERQVLMRQGCFHDAIIWPALLPLGSQNKSWDGAIQKVL